MSDQKDRNSHSNSGSQTFNRHFTENASLINKNDSKKKADEIDEFDKFYRDKLEKKRERLREEDKRMKKELQFSNTNGGINYLPTTHHTVPQKRISPQRDKTSETSLLLPALRQQQTIVGGDVDGVGGSPAILQGTAGSANHVTF